MKGTETAKSIEPSRDYILPLGKGRIALSAAENNIIKGNLIKNAFLTSTMGVSYKIKLPKNI